MSTDHAAHLVTEAAAGAAIDLAKRGGVNLVGYHAHGAQRLGEWAVRGAAAVAPGAVAAAAHGTAVVVAGVAAAAPALAVAAVGYGVYRLVKWLNK